MLQVIACPVGPLAANCYIVTAPGGMTGFVVDPGGDADEILAAIRQRQLTITHILLTHGHFDHIMAVAAVKAATGAEILIHSLDVGNLSSPEGCLFARFYGNRGHFEPCTADRTLEDGDGIDLGFTRLTVLHTPGHTPGCVCFDTGEQLFCGDTLFAGSCGRVDFPGGDPDAMRASLARLAALPGDRVCYAGHDETFTLEGARRFNPMLRAALA